MKADPPKTRRRRGAHRYGVGVRDFQTTLQGTTIDALRELIPAGQRGEFVDNAVRRALAEYQRKTGSVGALPGERLETIAQALEDQADQLRAHAKQWGEDS